MVDPGPVARRPGGRRPRICMLVTNHVRKDPRVQKEARLATERGYDVVVVGHLASSSVPRVERVDGYTIVRVAPEEVLGLPGPGCDIDRPWPSPESWLDRPVRDAWPIEDTIAQARHVLAQVEGTLEALQARESGASGSDGPGSGAHGLPKDGGPAGPAPGRRRRGPHALPRALAWSAGFALQGAAAGLLALPRALLRSLARFRFPSDLWRRPMALARATWGLQIPRDLGRVPLSVILGMLRSARRGVRERLVPWLYEVEEQAATRLAALEDPFEPEPESPPAPPALPDAAPVRAPQTLPNEEQDRFGFWWIHLLDEAIAQVAVALRPDIVHANDLDTLAAGWVVKREVGCPLVYDSHELWTEQHHPRTPDWIRYFRGLEAVLAPRVDRIVSVNDFIAREIAQRYGVAVGTTVYNAPFYSRPEGEAPTDLRALAGGRPIVLFQGRYDLERGLEELVEAAAHLRCAVLVFRGYGALDGFLRQRVRELGVGDRVFFVPPVEMHDMVEAARGADVGIIPYLPSCLNNRYCTPNKIFEYMMAGMAVATSDLPVMRQIVRGEGVGDVFDPADPGAIALTLDSIVEDPERLRAMKERALEAAARRYNWDREGLRLIALYHGLVPGGAGGVRTGGA